jgi:predicted transcriptional regulator
MTLKDMAGELKLEVLTAKDMLNLEVTNGYTSDLLSDVMANTKEGNLWITLQIHPNIIAVAKLKELCGIVIVNNRQPEEETVKKAEEEKVPLLRTADSAFTISGKIYGIIGPKE